MSHAKRNYELAMLALERRLAVALSRDDLTDDEARVLAANAARVYEFIATSTNEEHQDDHC